MNPQNNQQNQRQDQAEVSYIQPQDPVVNQASAIDVDNPLPSQLQEAPAQPALAQEVQPVLAEASAEPLQPTRPTKSIDAPVSVENSTSPEAVIEQALPVAPIGAPVTEADNSSVKSVDILAYLLFGSFLFQASALAFELISTSGSIGGQAIAAVVFAVLTLVVGLGILLRNKIAFYLFNVYAVLTIIFACINLLIALPLILLTFSISPILITVSLFSALLTLGVCIYGIIVLHRPGSKALFGIK